MGAGKVGWWSGGPCGRPPLFLFLFDPRYASTRCSCWRQIMTNRWSYYGDRVQVPREDASAIRDQKISCTCGQGLDGESRVCRSLGGQQTAITDKQVGNVMGATVTICDGSARVFSHPRAANEMSVAGFLDNLFGACSVHDLRRFFDSGLS